MRALLREAMRTDAHLHTIFLGHPDWIFQLIGQPDPGPCDVDSVHFKHLSSSPDTRITPRDAAQPLYVVEFQFVPGGDNILARTALSMSLAQKHYHLTHADETIAKAGLKGKLRPVRGLVILGPNVKAEPAEPWEKVVEVYQFANILSAFESRHPSHPIAHLFFPLMEPDLEKVDREAKEHYRTLAEIEKRGEIRPDLLLVFAEWFNQRHPKKTWEEIGMMLIEDLTPLEETRSWREAAEKGLDLREIMRADIARDIARRRAEEDLVRQLLNAKFGRLGASTSDAFDRLSYSQIRELAFDFLIMKDVEELKQWLRARGHDVKDD